MEQLRKWHDFWIKGLTPTIMTLTLGVSIGRHKVGGKGNLGCYSCNPLQ